MKTRNKALLACLTGYTIFGFSFMFSKIALNVVTPFVLLAARFLSAFVVMNLLLLTGKVKLSFRGKPVLLLLLMGIIQPVFGFAFEAYGVAMTTAAFSGVMIGLAPVVGLVLGAVFLKEKVTLFQVICTLLSVVGVVLTSSGNLGGNSLGGFLMLMGAVVSSSLFTIISRSTSSYFSAFERTYVMFALGGVIFSAIALFQNRSDLPGLMQALAAPELWIAVGYLAVASSVCAFMLINYALNYESAGRLLIFSNFTTVISVLAGIFLMGDSFSLTQLLGIVIITLSVFGVSYQKPGAAEA